MSTHSVSPIPARMERRPDGQPLADLLAYLQLLAGPAPRSDERFDLRWRIEHGRMAQRFIPARRLQAAAKLILRLAPRTDVYVGVALRRAGKGGGRAAIRGAHLLHIDLDHGHAASEALTPGRLACFALPTVEIATGTPGHRHFYWHLGESLPVRQLESANRRLALHLGGDPTAVDAARLLRPPSTLSWKHKPPRTVRLLAYREHARYTLGELTDLLPTDPHPPRLSPPAAAGRRGAPRTDLDRRLLAIPAAEYVRVLAGLTPDRAGKVSCPLHEDARPSLQLYADGSWYCFGACRRGGSIYDFAAALAGMRTRGEDFLRLRKQLAITFAVRIDPAR